MDYTEFKGSTGYLPIIYERRRNDISEEWCVVEHIINRMEIAETQYDDGAAKRAAVIDNTRDFIYIRYNTEVYKNRYEHFIGDMVDLVCSLTKDTKTVKINEKPMCCVLQ
jgi:hypothetical protein